MQPNPGNLLKRTGVTMPLIGLYVAPDPTPFEPLVSPAPGQEVCTFSFIEAWKEGKTLHLTRENYGCKGAGKHFFNVETWERRKFIEFLADTEGLKSSHDLMSRWLDRLKPPVPEYPHILIGPLKEQQYEFLKTVTFYVNPDQMSLLLHGAQYNSAPEDPPPAVVPFGSGCRQLMALFADLKVSQAIVGATDIAMRQFLPPDVLAFTVTKPLFEQLCGLDERSFLYKRFWENLRKARGLPEL